MDVQRWLNILIRILLIGGVVYLLDEMLGQIKGGIG